LLVLPAQNKLFLATQCKAIMSITQNLDTVLPQLAPYGATLVAVSKTKPLADILEAYSYGHRDFGENKVQELADKYEQLPKDIRWHMIGHLQRNKVKYIAPFVHLIHGGDSLKLLTEINKQAAKHNRKVRCLLQMHIAQEETKFGFSFDELIDLLDDEAMDDLHHVQVCGLMGMATNTPDEAQVKKEFGMLKAVYDKIKNSENRLFPMEVLSMGMSGDYPLALEAGSNMVRIGSAIFGARNYIK